MSSADTGPAGSRAVELEIRDLNRRLADALELEVDGCEVHPLSFHAYAWELVAKARNT